MGNKHYVVAIDLGSKNVTVAASSGRVDGRMVVDAVVRKPSQGVCGGAIDNIELAVASLKSAVAELEKQLNIGVYEAYFGISGEFIRCASHNDWVSVGDQSNGVSQSDIDELYARMEKVCAPNDDEIILERIPQNFMVDGSKEVANPVGSFGQSLSSTFNFILSTKTPIKRLTNAALKMGIKPLKTYINPVITPEVLLRPYEKEEGVAVVDIGADITDVTIYANNVLRYAASIPLGSDVINRDISTLSVPRQFVEQMKVEYGNASKEDVPKNEVIEFPIHKGKKSILKYNLAAIIEARVWDIADYVTEEIKHAGYEKKLPYGIVLAGGGSKLAGLAKALSEYMKMDVRVGTPEDVVDAESVKLVDGPEYDVVTGLLWRGLETGKYCYVDQRPVPPQPGVRDEDRVAPAPAAPKADEGGAPKSENTAAGDDQKDDGNKPSPAKPDDRKDDRPDDKGKNGGHGGTENQHRPKGGFVDKFKRFIGNLSDKMDEMGGSGDDDVI